MASERDVYLAVTGQALNQIRGKKRISQENLARTAGLSQSALSRFENGQTMPDLYESRRLAQALGMSHGDLVEFVEQAFARTTSAARKVTNNEPWAEIAVAALAGLALFGVAALLEESNKRRKKN